MPLVDVELIADDGPTPDLAPDLASTLADAIGVALGAEDGSTWVRLRTLSRDRYGESGGAVPDTIRPVFVTIISFRRPDGDELQAVAARTTTAVAATTGHPVENVHLIFEPDGAGRVSFGGRLRR